MEAGQVEEAPVKERVKGEYLVLQQIKTQDGSSPAAFEAWVEVVGAYTIREAFKLKGEGTYVRVPRRSWKPQTAKTEQVERIKIT